MKAPCLYWILVLSAAWAVNDIKYTCMVFVRCQVFRIHGVIPGWLGPVPWVIENVL